MQKALDKIYHPFMIRTQKTQSRGKFSSTLQRTKTSTAHIFRSEKLLPPEIRSKARMFSFITAIQHNTQSSSQCSKERKEIRHTDQKKTNKTVSVCKWHDISRKSQRTYYYKSLRTNK